MDRSSINLNHLSDNDIKRLLEISKKMMEAPSWKVVLVKSRNGYYLRKAPGALQLEKRIGAKHFAAIVYVAGVGFDAYKDSKRKDLNAGQKIGRTSLSILEVHPLVGLVSFGASVILGPDKVDKFKTDFFSNKNPVVDFLSNKIVQVGGKKFQKWSTKPSWVDY